MFIWTNNNNRQTNGVVMELACNNCGKRNTKVVPGKKLSELLNTTDTKALNPDTKHSLNVMSGSVAMTGTIDPKIFIKLFPLIIKLAESLLDWLKKKEKNKSTERNVIVCMDCGHWEKI